MIKILMMFLLTTNLYAATVWTPQPERYNTYNVTPTKATQKLVRIPITEPDSVQPEWVKIGGEWIKEVTAKGAVRYVPAPLPDECIATFVCHVKWGWIINISQDTVFVKCKAIKILNEQAVVYDNRVKDVGCPSILK
jgi:hypothetical protein